MPPIAYRRSFYFNATAPTEISTLSLHDALPIFAANPGDNATRAVPARVASCAGASCCCRDHHRGRGYDRDPSRDCDLTVGDATCPTAAGGAHRPAARFVVVGSVADAGARSPAGVAAGVQT